MRRSAGGGSFAIADVEGLGVTTTAAKMLLNALVKLGRCEVHNALGGGAAGMLYRVKQA